MSDRGTLVGSRMARISPPSFTHEDLLRRRERKVLRRRVTAAVVAVVAFGAVGIWWAAVALRDAGVNPADRVEEAKRQLVLEADEICLTAQSEFDSRQLTPPRATWSLDRQAAFFRYGLRVFGQMNVRLRALTPPPNLRAAMASAIEEHRRHLDTVARAVEAAEAGNRHAFERLIRRAFGSVQSKAIEAFEAALGDLTACP